MIKYVVRLTKDERSSLMELIDKGKAATRKIKHANVLLKIDAERLNWSDVQAAEAFSCSPRTVFTIRQRFVEFGLDAALERKPRTQPRERLLDGEGEAHLVRIACSTPPEGQARWPLKRLVAWMEREFGHRVSRETVRQALKRLGFSWKALSAFRP